MLHSLESIVYQIGITILILLSIYEWLRILTRQIRRGWEEGKNYAEYSRNSWRWFKKRFEKKPKVWVMKLSDGRVAITGSQEEMAKFVASHKEDGNMGEFAWNIPISEYQVKII